MKSRLAATLFALVSSVVPMAHGGSFSAAINIADEVDAIETGMRVYPGATPVGKRGRDNDSASLQFSFGEYGLKVIAAKLRSADSPERIASFYRSELARFGEVLDCGAPDRAAASQPNDKKSQAIGCDGDKPRKNGMLYKAGRKSDQHVVEIKPHADGSEFSLVHVRVRSPD